MLGDEAHRLCFGKVSQRAVFDTQPIREEDVSRSWTELLEESDGGENEKPPQRGVIDGWRFSGFRGWSRDSLIDTLLLRRHVKGMK